ncbi:unnamed protein product [Aphanomyces euteiches]
MGRTKEMVAIAPAAVDTAVDILNIRFPSLCNADLYNAKLTTCNGVLPLRLCLESQQSQMQWLCNVVDFAKHHVPPDDVSLILPSAFLLATLEEALRAASSRLSEAQDTSVDLNHPKNQTSYLSLTIQLKGKLCATYCFELTPLTAPPPPPTPALMPAKSAFEEEVESKLKGLRDSLSMLQQEFLHLQERSLLPYLHVAATKPTPPGGTVHWNVVKTLPQDCFALTQGNHAIQVLRLGLYHIQIKVITPKDRVGLQLLIDGVPMAAAPTHYLIKGTRITFLSPTDQHGPVELRIFLLNAIE